MILLTGATGNVGSEVAKDLSANGVPYLIATRGSASDPSRERELDFERPETFKAAVEGIDRLFLMRPPQLTDIELIFRPFLTECKRAKVKKVVFLSLLGAEKNPWTPHRKIEREIERLGLDHCFLRASFFMQNLTTTHRDDIRELREILVPAGHGRTSFIDAKDIGEVAAMLLAKPELHSKPAYELTGSEALTYDEVARIITEELGTPIAYENPSLLRFAWHMTWKRKYPLGFVSVMAGIYTVARLGRAGRISHDAEFLLNRKPTTMRDFVRAHAVDWSAR